MSTPGEETRRRESTPTVETPRQEDEGLEHRLRRMTRRGFAWGGAAALSGLAGWRWLVTRTDEDGLPWPFRRVLGLDERLGRALFRASPAGPPVAPRAGPHA